MQSTSVKVVATNRKARFQYELLELYEAGIALKGSEIKSVRAGRVNLNDAYVEIRNGSPWLVNAHIAPYEPSSRFGHEPLRDRRLLLRKSEIRQLGQAVRERGLTIVPTQMVLKNGMAKLEIALARGKKVYDKRESIAKRDQEREMSRELKVGR
jgi:SsrA-binding protein